MFLACYFQIIFRHLLWLFALSISAFPKIGAHPNRILSVNKHHECYKTNWKEQLFSTWMMKGYYVRWIWGFFSGLANLVWAGHGPCKSGLPFYSMKSNVPGLPRKSLLFLVVMKFMGPDNFPYFPVNQALPNNMQMYKKGRRITCGWFGIPMLIPCSCWKAMFSLSRSIVES